MPFLLSINKIYKPLKKAYKIGYQLVKRGCSGRYIVSLPT